LLAWGALVGAAATLPGLVAAPVAVGRESWLRRATYTRRVGETFHAVVGNGHTVPLRLIAVEDLAASTARGTSLAGREDAFLLVLRGPEVPKLSQGVFELRHRTLGRNQLFLVPEEHENTYAVVINRVAR
jgi:hypothetical protein